MEGSPQTTRPVAPPNETKTGNHDGLLLGEKLRKRVTEALADYHMIEEGDRVMVAVSGGKDSSALVLLLDEIRRKAPFSFTLTPVMLDQNQPGFDPQAYCNWFRQRGFEIQILKKDTYSIVTEKVPDGKTYCGLCSRLRRGILYNHAHASGYTKIALGHHRDDMNETLLMNLFYNGQIAGMPPKLRSDDERNVVIRPLAYAAEEDIRSYVQSLGLPLIPCNLCGSQSDLKRQKIKGMLSRFADENGNVPQSLIKAQGNVKPTHLMDGELQDFENL